MTFGSPGAWIELNDLPQARAVAAVRSGAPVVLLANPVEYHGPHLSLRNDHWVSRGLAEDLRRGLQADLPSPWLSAGELELAVEAASGPGSRRTSFEVVRDVAVEACERLADLGARRVIVLTFHGSPLHSAALWAGIERLRARGVRAVAPLNVLFRALLAGDPTELAPAFAMVADAAARAELMAQARTDLHAGYMETALALHYAPHTVGDHRAVPPCPPVAPHSAARAAARAVAMAGRGELAAELDLVAFGLGWTALRPFPGYTSCPALATAEAGAAFARIAMARLVPAVADVLGAGGEAPPPILRWLAAATLRGRLAGIGVPLGEMVSFPPSTHGTAG